MSISPASLTNPILTKFASNTNIASTNYIQVNFEITFEITRVFQENNQTSIENFFFLVGNAYLKLKCG